ncbi:Crp/Fnr family transcriptional regulator [Blastococcus saxobsidens]|uniref:Transcriptional regulator n=1 Tax=Blastococcus saxobsidens TaxID=138336 RepID=A0A4Q7YCW2_9ACTN|nr:Crp/Fnr family transcriptional regulator [Blastococcus saxobsidens]RZU34494.1 transcriptional regulator [Blastococcus saxobsidens]
MTVGPRGRWISGVSARHDLTLLEGEMLAHLRKTGTPRGAAAGQLVAAAGQETHRVLVVLDGELELLARLPSGGRVVMALVRRGGVIADIPVLLGSPMPFDAVASRDTWVIEITDDEWIRLLQQFPALSLRWMASIARRLDADRRRLAVMMTRRLEAQVTFILLEQQEQQSGRVVVRLTHEVIADLVGARRQSVSRVMRTLTEAELIRNGYGQVELLDVPGLKALLGGDLLPQPTRG